MSTLAPDVLAEVAKSFREGEHFYTLKDERVRVAAYYHNGVWNTDLYLFQPDNSTMLLSAVSPKKGADITGFTLMVPSTCTQIHSQVLNTCFSGTMEFVVVDKSMYVKVGQKRRQLTPLTKRTSIDLAEYWQQ